jgi:hypothetical protein
LLVLGLQPADTMPTSKMKSEVRIRFLTMELTHAGPIDAAREAEPNAPTGVVCSDFVRRSHNCRMLHSAFPVLRGS